MSSDTDLIRILAVDDHKLIRRGIAALVATEPDMRVVAEGTNGREAVKEFRAHRPDVTLMDFQMPEMNGLEATRQIIKNSPGTPILMLTVYATSQLMEQARRAGVKGFCPKSEVHCIVEAVTTLLDGGTYFQNRALAK